MSIADTKKVQAIRNLWYTRVAQQILNADEVVASIRMAITSNNLAGQFTAGELTAMLAVETSLNTLAGLVGVTAAESVYDQSHGNHSLIIDGVNN